MIILILIVVYLFSALILWVFAEINIIPKCIRDITVRINIVKIGQYYYVERSILGARRYLKEYKSLGSYAWHEREYILGRSSASNSSLREAKQTLKRYRKHLKAQAKANKRTVVKEGV